MNDLKERLSDLGTTIPGTVGILAVVLAAAYDAIRQGYQSLVSMGFTVEISEAALMKLAVGAVCIGLILSKGSRKPPKE